MHFFLDIYLFNLSLNIYNQITKGIINLLKKRLVACCFNFHLEINTKQKCTYSTHILAIKLAKHAFIKNIEEKEIIALKIHSSIFLKFFTNFKNQSPN